MAIGVMNFPILSAEQANPLAMALSKQAQINKTLQDARATSIQNQVMPYILAQKAAQANLLRRQQAAQTAVAAPLARAKLETQQGEIFNNPYLSYLWQRQMLKHMMPQVGGQTPNFGVHSAGDINPAPASQGAGAHQMGGGGGLMSPMGAAIPAMLANSFLTPQQKAAQEAQGHLFAGDYAKQAEQSQEDAQNAQDMLFTLQQFSDAYDKSHLTGPIKGEYIPSTGILGWIGGKIEGEKRGKTTDLTPAQLADQYSAVLQGNRGQELFKRGISNYDLKWLERSKPTRALEPQAKNIVVNRLIAAAKRKMQQNAFYNEGRQLGLDPYEIRHRWTTYSVNEPIFDKQGNPRNYKGDEYRQYLRGNPQLDAAQVSTKREARKTAQPSTKNLKDYSTDELLHLYAQLKGAQ